MSAYAATASAGLVPTPDETVVGNDRVCVPWLPVVNNSVSGSVEPGPEQCLRPWFTVHEHDRLWVNEVYDAF